MGAAATKSFFPKISALGEATNPLPDVAVPNPYGFTIQPEAFGSHALDATSADQILQEAAKTVINIPIAEDLYFPESKSDEILTKFLTGQSYNSSDMKLLVEDLFSNNEKYKIDSQILTAVSLQEIERFLSGSKRFSPKFIVYQDLPKSWIVIALFKTKDVNANGAHKWNVLFKNPSGNKINDDLVASVRKYFGYSEIFANRSNNLTSGDLTYSGALTIRNLKIFKDNLEADEMKFCESIAEVKFVEDADLERAKKIKLKLLVQRICANDSFKGELAKLKAQCDAEFCLRAFHRKLWGGITNLKSYEKYRNRYLMNLRLDKGKTILLDNQIQGYESEIDAFGLLSKILTQAKNDSNLSLTIDYLGQTLPLDFSFLNQDKEAKEAFTPFIGTPDSCKASDFKSDSPSWKLPSVISGVNGKTIETLSNSIDENYKHLNLDCGEIRKWADGNRGSLRFDNENIPQNVSMIERGFYLATGGKISSSLRVALLILLQDPQKRFVELPRGEGKDFLIALLAIARVMQGQKVDVITGANFQAVKAVKLTRKLYNLFGVSVDSNCYKERKLRSPTCYLHDVVYGSLKNFQFDFLKEEMEAFQLRKGRNYDFVIVDDIDTLAINRVAKIVEPLPGFESLRYSYINIWLALDQVEKIYQEDKNYQLKLKLAEVGDKVMLDNMKREEAQLQYEQLLEVIMSTTENDLIDRVLKIELADYSLVPEHLQYFLRTRIEKWVRNAMRAKFEYKENREYIVREGRIIPVDSENFGEDLVGGFFTNGLQQFLELKHGLRVTPEYVKGSFVSNTGYLSKYGGMTCVSGASGSTDEHQFLFMVYGLEASKVLPTAPSNFTKIRGVIIPDASWASTIISETIRNLQSNRPTLILCNSIADALFFKKQLQFVQTLTLSFNLRTILTMTDFEQFDVSLQPHDIIIATPLATKLHLKSTESSGLHIIITFLPRKKLVEEQALGITSTGSAQIIEKTSEVTPLKLSNPSDISEAKVKIGKLEAARLQFLKEELKQIKFKDEMFERFSSFYKNYRTLATDSGRYCTLRDLKDNWALWLDRNNYSSDKVCEKEFQIFLREKNIVETLKFSFDDFHSFNPYYNILRADHEIGWRLLEDAEKRLLQALRSQNDFLLLPGAHLKLFGIQLEKLDNISRNFDKSNKIFDASRGEVRLTAIDHLKNAQKALNHEICYLKENVLCEAAINPKVEAIILKAEKSSFLEQFKSRLGGLQVLEKMTQILFEKMEKFSETDKLIVRFKIPFYFLKFSSIVHLEEIVELISNGLDCVYSIKDIIEIPSEISLKSKYFIDYGLGLAKKAIFFPFLRNCLQILISEGACDLILFSLENDANAFPEGPLVRSRTIKTLTVGDVNVKEIVKKIILTSQKVTASFARDHVDQQLQKCIQAFDANVNRGFLKILNQAKPEQFTSSFQFILPSGKIVKMFMVRQLFTEFYIWLDDHLKDKINKSLRSSKTLRRKIKYTSLTKAAIVNLMASYLKTNPSLIILAKSIAARFQSIFKDWSILNAVMKDKVEGDSELDNFADSVCRYLEENCKGPSLTVRFNMQDEKDLLEEISEMAANKIKGVVFKLLTELIYLSNANSDGAAKIKEVIETRKAVEGVVEVGKDFGRFVVDYISVMIEYEHAKGLQDGHKDDIEYGKKLYEAVKQKYDKVAA